MRRIKALLMAFVLAVPLLAVAAPALASQYQQDGYHYTPAGTGGRWVDDRCNTYQPGAIDAVLFANTAHTGEYTEICGQVDNLGDVPWGPPFMSGGSWSHLNLNNRIKGVECFADPGKYLKLFPDVNKGGTVAKVWCSTSVPFYSSPGDFPSATTSSIGSGT